MTPQDPDLAEVIRRERLLLDPANRSDSALVTSLLHPDYVEYGASGKVWDRPAAVEALRADPAVPDPATDFDAAKLAADVVLVTFRIHGVSDSLRSSVWVREGSSDWRLRFHQGTPVPRTPVGADLRPGSPTGPGATGR